MSTKGTFQTDFYSATVRVFHTKVVTVNGEKKTSKNINIMCYAI